VLQPRPTLANGAEDRLRARAVRHVAERKLHGRDGIPVDL
jgi:hypothetical protein